MYTAVIIPNSHPELVAIPAELDWRLLLDKDGNPLGHATILENINLRTVPILAWTAKIEESRATGIGPRVSVYPIVPNTHRDTLTEPHYIVLDILTKHWSLKQCDDEDSDVGMGSLVLWMIANAQGARHCSMLASVVEFA